MDRLQQIKKEIEKQQKLYTEVFNKAGSYPTLQQYLYAIEPFSDKLEALSREKRMLMTYKLEKLPDFGSVMSLKDFIETVKMGGFIDYDGSGNYVKNGKMTDIDIFPSDVEFNKIRKDFDTIIWFNR